MCYYSWTGVSRQSLANHPTHTSAHGERWTVQSWICNYKKRVTRQEAHNKTRGNRSEWHIKKKWALRDPKRETCGAVTVSQLRSVGCNEVVQPALYPRAAPGLNSPTHKQPVVVTRWWWWWWWPLLSLWKTESETAPASGLTNKLMITDDQCVISNE